jgi:hypothetical protein
VTFFKQQPWPVTFLHVKFLIATNVSIRVLCGAYVRDSQHVFCVLKLFAILQLMHVHWSHLQAHFVTKNCMYFQCLRDCSPEDGESIFLRNDGIYLRVHTASQTRITSSACSDISNVCVCVFYVSALCSEIYWYAHFESSALQLTIHYSKGSFVTHWQFRQFTETKTCLVNKL